VSTKLLSLSQFYAADIFQISRVLLPTTTNQNRKLRTTHRNKHARLVWTWSLRSTIR